MRCRSVFLSSSLLLFALGCGDSRGVAHASGPAPAELSGGATTVHDTGRDAFSMPARNLTPERRSAFFVGNSFFKQNWVIAPASTAARDGLGPLFNARSCSACHFKDGRGRPPEPGEEMLSMLLRLSLPGADATTGAPLPEPTYGGQLQPHGVPGVPGEGRVRVAYEELPGSFADGTPYSLRQPTYRFESLSSGPLAADVLFSPRVAPHMIGMGLLEAIPEETIRALADPDDEDGDGIAGVVNEVWDVKRGRKALGRFGWKANQPTTEQQVAGAFHGDIGITSSLFPGEDRTPAQTEALAAASGGEPELSDHILQRVVFYSQTLAVPARRDVDDATVLEGERLFREAGCAKCHIPELTTGTLEGFPELSNQKIQPFTDLLLHDMGEGLADGREDFAATGSQWRTPPLWGIGLIETVNGHTTLLHDGRARNLSEAILWHGGEGEESKEAYRAMSAEERAALLRYLESL